MNVPAHAQHRRMGRALVALLICGAWLIGNLLAVSPQLHHQLHGDSTAATHECFVTQLASGQVSLEVPVLVVAAPAAAIIAPLPPVEFHFDGAADYRLPQSCGPPWARFATASG